MTIQAKYLRSPGCSGEELSSELQGQLRLLQPSWQPLGMQPHFLLFLYSPLTICMP